MAGYIGSRASVVSSGAERKKTFDITTTTTVLAGLSYTPTFVHVFHNGVRLVDGTDYTATNSTSITLTTAAQSGDQVVVVSYATFQAADAYTKAETYTKSEADAGFVSDPNGAVTVDASGNVGIGTATPSLLQSYGNTLVVGSGSGAHGMTVFSSPAEYGALLFADGTGTNAELRAGEITYDHSTSSMFIKTAATERMRIDASGRVTMPYQPAFNAYAPAKTATKATVIYGTTRSNIGNHYNVTTGRFTAPIAGTYFFSFNSLMGLPYTAGHVRLWFDVNGVRNATYGDSLLGNDGIVPYSSISMSISLYLNANEYISVWNDGTIPTYGTSYGQFSGHLIG